MKHRSLKQLNLIATVALGLTTIAASPANARGNDGHGGDAIVCLATKADADIVRARVSYNKDRQREGSELRLDVLGPVITKIRSVTMLDLVEGGYSIDKTPYMQASKTDYRKTILEPLKRFLGERTIFADRYATLEQQLPFTEWQTGAAGVDSVDDAANRIQFGDKCVPVQAAVRDRVGPGFLISYDTRLLDMMDGTNRAALELHENLGALYDVRDVLYGLPADSRLVRALVRILLKRTVFDLSHQQVQEHLARTFGHAYPQRFVLRYLGREIKIDSPSGRDDASATEVRLSGWLAKPVELPNGISLHSWIHASFNPQTLTVTRIAGRAQLPALPILVGGGRLAGGTIWVSFDEAGAMTELSWSWDGDRKPYLMLPEGLSDLAVTPTGQVLHSLPAGTYLEGLSKDRDTFAIRAPLGGVVVISGSRCEFANEANVSTYSCILLDPLVFAGHRWPAGHNLGIRARFEQPQIALKNGLPVQLPIRIEPNLAY